MLELPIGIQNFTMLRSENFLYVDKTGKLLDLVMRGRRYFLSRPRRFGKSLTLSTLEAMFKGQANLFSGLAAEEWVKKQSENPCVVLRFDMSTRELGSTEIFIHSLKSMLKRKALNYDIEIMSDTLNDMLEELLEALYKKQGQIVVLIDEYDKPILDNIDSLQKAQEMREILRSFYMVLKGCDEYLKFVMLTGISKFSKIGVFSAMNNLDDISMDRRYGDMLGYTQAELEKYFAEWIDSTSEQMGIAKVEFLCQMKNYYDGFSFDGEKRIYNPFSIMQCLSKAQFGNYWYVSGSPTFIIRYMKTLSISDPDQYRHLEVPEDFLDSHEIEYSTPESFLYQSGYLTIEKRQGDILTLDYPNEGVMRSINRMYLDDVYHVKQYITLGNQIWQALSAGEIDKTIALYNEALAEIPYDDFPKRDEFWYRSLFLMLLKGAGIISYAEVHTFKGRADIVIQFRSQIIVLEFKFAVKNSDVDKMRLLGNAQLRDREYAKSYKVSGVKVIEKVVVANDEERKLIV